MFFLKKLKLEKELMKEIKYYAKVDHFPYDDAEIIGKLLSSYSKGMYFVTLYMMTSLDTLEKYPQLLDNWDDLMIKYKKLGLFPKWNVKLN